MKTRFYTILIVLLILSVISCQKDTNTISQTGIDLADDDAVSDVIYEDVFSTADNATIILDMMFKGGDSKSEVVVTDSCPTLTITNPEGGSWPKLITVDFGDGCTGLYDNSRSGKIFIEVTGPRHEVGSKRTITFDNYYFNNIKVEGVKVIENIGYNENQNPLFSVRLTGGKLTLPDGKTIERTVEHQREWIAGFDTHFIWDDECLVTGTAGGKTINGVSYTNTITTALLWKRVCFFIVSGVVKIEREGADAIELDYGTGECDARAMVTAGGETKEILLRPKHRSMSR